MYIGMQNGQESLYNSNLRAREQSDSYFPSCVQTYVKKAKKHPQNIWPLDTSSY